MQCYPSKPASIVRIRLWRGITAGECNIVAVSIASLGRHCGFDARFLHARAPSHNADVGTYLAI